MRRKEKKKSVIKSFLIFGRNILFSIILIILGAYIYMKFAEEGRNENNIRSIRLSTNDGQIVDNLEEVDSYKILENITKSVVGISKLKSVGSSVLQSTNENELGLGTGMIVSSNGYILSNEHVTGEKYSKCYVTLENGMNYEGNVVWSNSNLDLSITKIKEDNLTCVNIGDSKDINLGQEVYAIGNPIGFEFRRTVTFGIISGKNRSIKLEDSIYMSDLIQTDATINPGNSGGPLILKTGEVIGINTVKIEEAESIGFAIPINVVKPVIESFKENGSFNEASIGVYAYDKDVVPYLDNEISFAKGIYVAELDAAFDETIDLKVGDIILKIDGKLLNSMNDLREYIYSKKSGDVVKLDVLRGKISKTIMVTLL